MAIVQGIQIIGTQRSGSNLVRLMLNQTDDISAPHPPHIIDRFFPLLGYYGNLEDDLNFNRLIQDVSKLVTYNPVPWRRTKFSCQEIKGKCQQNSLFEIFRAIYELNAEFEGARFWCCKSMVNINYVNQLEEAGIHPKYIHLFRDGRDVALSFKKAIVGEKHMYHLAKKWSKEQKLGMDLLNRLESNRIMQVRYEDLLHNPEKELKNVCEFLQVRYSPKMLDYYVSEESNNTALSGEMWKNVVKPVINNNYNKFKNELSIREIEIFEKVAGHTLKDFGFTPFFDHDKKVKSFTSKEVALFNEENKRLKEEILNKISSDDLKKRSKQKILLDNIKMQQHLQIAEYIKYEEENI